MSRVKLSLQIYYRVRVHIIMVIISIFKSLSLYYCMCSLQMCLVCPTHHYLRLSLVRLVWSRLQRKPGDREQNVEQDQYESGEKVNKETKCLDQ